MPFEPGPPAVRHERPAEARGQASTEPADWPIVEGAIRTHHGSLMSPKPRRCPSCKRVADEASAWCNFCGRMTSRSRSRDARTRHHVDAMPSSVAPRCTPHDLGGLEAALSSRDPLLVARALTARVAGARGGKPLLPPGCRLVLDRRTLSVTSAGAAIEATVVGPSQSRWRLHLQQEAGGWKAAKMERVLEPAVALSKSA